MKTFKTSLIVLLAVFLSSCVIEENNYYENSLTLDEVLQSSGLWYIDINQTSGSSETRFMALAFTVSFQNGKIFANNNLVGLGSVGNGYGDQVGYYSTNNNVLTVDHDLDGYHDFEVFQVNDNIKFKDLDRNVTYTLIPYSINSFDYDKIFNDNIEYFLQEYGAWEKTATIGGVANEFDEENYVAFIPENVNVFRSSQDDEGTTVSNLLWDFEGEYEIFNVQGTDTIKVLTLNYDGNNVEEFELTVLNDGKVELYHISSETAYKFNGRENIVYKKDGSIIKKEPRKRVKVTRKVKNIKKHITPKGNRR